MSCVNFTFRTLYQSLISQGLPLNLDVVDSVIQQTDNIILWNYSCMNVLPPNSWHDDLAFSSFFQREIVEQLLQESDGSYSVICDNLKKVYHAKDGNPEKIAVTELSLYMQRGQCFGILGPNGAGKTSLISMVSMSSLRCITIVYNMFHTAISLFKGI